MSNDTRSFYDQFYSPANAPAPLPPGGYAVTHNGTTATIAHKGGLGSDFKTEVPVSELPAKIQSINAEIAASNIDPVTLQPKV